MAKNRFRANRQNKKRLGLLLILLIIVGVGYLFLKHRQPTKTNSTAIASTTIHSLPSKTAANDGTKQSTSSTGINQGTSTDNHGVVSTPVNSAANQWSVSQSGAITVKEPVQNTTLKSGAQLVGSATVSEIQYTLIDNQVGVISQGNVSVVNGAFSALMGFQSYASSGRLDVYSTDTNGKEINLVEIPVNF